MDAAMVYVENLLVRERLVTQWTYRMVPVDVVVVVFLFGGRLVELLALDTLE